MFSSASKIAAAVLALGAGFLFLLRPLAYDVSAGPALAFWGYFLGFVALPGVILARRLGLGGDDPFARAALGLALGLALARILFALAKIAGVEGALVVYPLLSLALLRGCARGPRQTPRPGLASGLLGFALLALVAQERHSLFSTERVAQPLPVDFLFHAGNAAELKNHWPLTDPRVAGRPLVYHFFGYGLPAGASLVSGLPVAKVLLALLPGPLVVILAALLFTAGRVLGESPWAGLLAAGLVLFHADLGVGVWPALGGFHSHLESGIFGSTTTLLGLVDFAAMACLLPEILTARARPLPWPPLVALGLLSLSASGTKGSVMPVVLAGLLVPLMAGWRRSGRLPAGPLAALLVAGAAAAPATLYLTTGGESFSTMFEWRPGTVSATSPFFERACGALGAPRAGESGPCASAPGAYLAVSALWALGYFGAAGVFGCLWLLERRARLGDHDLWAVGVLVAGMLPALLFASSSGLSQLFFVYNGQLLLGLMGGAGMAGVLAAPRRRPLCAALAVLALAVFGYTSVWAAVDGVSRDLAQASSAPSPGEAAFARGLAFLREHTPTDAVVAARPGPLFVSALGERRAFYETGYFTPSGHRQRRRQQGSDPFPERSSSLRRFLTSADRKLIEAHLALGARDPEILLFSEALELRQTVGWLLVTPRARPAGAPAATSPLTALFDDEAVAVYRVERAPPAGSP